MRAFLLMLMGTGVLLAVAIRGKSEWLLNLVMRGILGLIAIYFINMTLGSVDIVTTVGVNAVTILTTGILGIPGLLALYGVGIYQLL